MTTIPRTAPAWPRRWCRVLLPPFFKRMIRYRLKTFATSFNSSEARGTASEPDVSDRWNDKWGFGLVDASCALDYVLDRACTPLEDNDDIIVTRRLQAAMDLAKMSP